MNFMRENLTTVLIVLGGLALVYFLFLRPGRDITVVTTPDLTNPESTPKEQTYRIVTLLPRDGIPAIDNPEFYSAESADAEYAPDELILGVSINGENRAYSTSFLDSHEIVNDTVGGHKIAVTW